MEVGEVHLDEAKSAQVSVSIGGFSEAVEKGRCPPPQKASVLPPCRCSTMRCDNMKTIICYLHCDVGKGG